ncbi:MAG: divergent polysaccharide deacetylase family protein [Mariprofundaceae bacterium]|nr:divergent polysaccharide deacetylase family protein [Mariprofundaceae bacterium]
MRSRLRQKPWLLYVIMGLLLILSWLVGLMIWKISSFETHQRMQETVAPKVITPDVKVTAPSRLPHQAIADGMDDAPALVPDKPKKPVVVEKDAVVKNSPVVAMKVGIALIMDDMGYDKLALKRLLALSIPITVSILPNAPHAVAVATSVHQAGQMVMLHLPMEPMGDYYRKRMDSSFLRAGMDETTVRSMILTDLTHIPYVEGINNHMGSRLTSMIEPMTWVMQVCREKNLFFVDSKTSSKSLAATVAQQYGLSWGLRAIFLDDSVKPEALKKSWTKIERCVQQQQRCIVIAHPHPQTLDFLESKLSILQHWPINPLRSILHPAQSIDMTEKNL